MSLRAKNPYDSWLAGCYGLHFTMFDTFFSRARMNCGLSAKLVGTGFAVHRAVFECFDGWNTETIAEDAEFSALCAAHGIRVHFVPAALTYDEAPASFRVSLRQRRRWCSGIMDAATRLDRVLISALRGGAPLRAFDSLMVVNAPFLQAFSVLPPILSLAAALLCGHLVSLMPALLCMLAVSVLGCMALATLLAFLGAYRDRRIVKTILLFPLFMASWLPLQLISLVCRTKSWQPIAHTRALRADELRAAQIF